MTSSPATPGSPPRPGRGSPDLPTIRVRGPWTDVLEGRARSALEAALPPFLRSRRWFGGKARTVARVTLLDAVPLPGPGPGTVLCLARVEYAESAPEVYALCLGFDPGRTADAGVALLATASGEGLLHEALGAADVERALLRAILRGQCLAGRRGRLVATAGREIRRVLGPEEEALRLEPRPLRAEQSNSSVVFGRKAILKLFRRAEAGTNPDLEIGAYLTEQARFPNVPPVAGWIEYRPPRGQGVTLAILQGFVPNAGDAWSLALDDVGAFFDRVLTGDPDLPLLAPGGTLLEMAGREADAAARELLGPALARAALLGRRTAEMHLALSSFTDDEAFAPEPLTSAHQRSLGRALQERAGAVFALLRRRLGDLDARTRAAAEDVLSRREELLGLCRSVLAHRITAWRTRLHGDYHLGQVLWTGEDFVILDFEGEPAHTLAERRRKRSPLRDVAGMVRSYHYAAHHGLGRRREEGAVPPGQEARAEAWAEGCYASVSASFLRGYLEAAGDAPHLPPDRAQLEGLLDVYLLEKAVYELGYELDNRPAWVRLPLRGLAQLLEEASRRGGGAGKGTRRGPRRGEP